VTTTAAAQLLGSPYSVAIDDGQYAVDRVLIEGDGPLFELCRTVLADVDTGDFEFSIVTEQSGDALDDALGYELKLEFDFTLVTGSAMTPVDAFLLDTVVDDTPQKVTFRRERFVGGELPLSANATVDMRYGLFLSGGLEEDRRHFFYLGFACSF
jgi:hypothetical protein